MSHINTSTYVEFASLYIICIAVCVYIYDLYRLTVHAYLVLHLK